MWSSIIPLHWTLKHIIAYDGKIPFEYLKTAVTMQDSALSEIGRNLVFEDESHLCESQRVDLGKDVCIYFV